MGCSCCNLDTRKGVAYPWIIPAARLVCHTLCVAEPTSRKLALDDVDGGANSQGKPTRSQVRAPRIVEISWRSYISSPTCGEPADREPDRHTQVEAFGEAEH